MSHRLKTLGHATLLLFENDVPLIATDPWLVGSTYWRSWWLEKYPTDDEFEAVRDARYLYITHSHPDHFHYPTLRALNNRSTLHPDLEQYEIPTFLVSNGFDAQKLTAWTWFRVTDTVRIASIPVPVDDSLLVIETPGAYVVDLNDAMPRSGLLRLVREKMLENDKPVILLKSYSPASIAAAIYREGKRTQMKTKTDYADTAMQLAETLGATHFVPFASQAFFNRTDSRWANEFKVTYEDLLSHWASRSTELCKPFSEIDLDTLAITSTYMDIDRTLSAENQRKIAEREDEEVKFTASAELPMKLERYMGELYFLRWFYRRGIGWRLTNSGKEYFYSTPQRKILDGIPDDHDVVINLPDKVLAECLENNILTDLGISMFIKVETRISAKLTYGLFLLMGLHDYGHFNSLGRFVRFARFYFPYFFPITFRIKWLLTSRPWQTTKDLDG